MSSSSPSSEPSSGRSRIDGCRKQPPSSLREVTSRVEQHVGERVPHLARRAQHVEMEAVREHRSAPAEDPVHGSRDARTDGLHSAGEIACARRLDDQMHVIVLDRVMDEPEAPAVARRSEAALELAYEPHGTERRQSAPHLQRDVTGKARRELRSRAARMARARAALAARTRASSSPARYLSEIEVELSNASRHRMHCDM